MLAGTLLFLLQLVPRMNYKRQNGKTAEIMQSETAPWKRECSCIQRHTQLQGKDREITLGGRRRSG